MSSNPYATPAPNAGTSFGAAKNGLAPWLLSITSAISLVGLPAVLLFGGSHWTTALMFWALPITATVSALACIVLYKRGPWFPLVISGVSLSLCFAFGLLVLWMLFSFELPAQQ